jgi:hypothetical protein
MAFTDPIIAGEELTRQSLKSDNYIPGVSGWRIARDGAAEFDNLGIRGNLWVPSISLGGRDLESRLSALPLGVVAWVSGYPAENTTTERQIMFTAGDVVAGRWYEIGLTSIMPDISGARATEFVLRIGRSSAAVVDNNSEVMAVSSRLNQFDLGDLRVMWKADYTGRLKLRASIHSLDNVTNVRCWAPGSGCVLYMYDMGIPTAFNGVVGAGVPVRTLKEFTITAQYSKTFLGDGTHRTDGSYQYTMIMGDWSNGKGNQRGWCSFATSDVATYLDDLVNVPASDVVTAELKLRAIGQWKNVDNTGIVSLGFHSSHGPLPAGNEPGGGIPNVCRYTLNGYNPFWFDLKPGGGGGGVPSNFLDSMRDGYLNGFMVGNTFAGNSYCGILAGAWYPDQAYNTPPQLHMKYYKLV